jgi:hypothetical protein
VNSRNAGSLIALTAALHNIGAAKKAVDKLLEHLDTSRRVRGCGGGRERLGLLGVPVCVLSRAMCERKGGTLGAGIMS